MSKAKVRSNSDALRDGNETSTTTESHRDTAYNVPHLAAARAAQEAAKKAGVGDAEADHIGKEVARAMEELPQLSWFGSNNVQPGHNSDIALTVSLNGRLLRVERGRDEKGQGTHGEELYGINWMQVDQLVGRLLTLCDATFTDPIQRKAFKDRVRHDVKGWMADVITDAAADAWVELHLTTPFVGGVLDQEGGLFGVEGEPTP